MHCHPKAFLPFFSLLCGLVGTAQRAVNEGEGIVTTTIYFLSENGPTRIPDISMGRRYFIKGNKVLRKDSVGIVSEKEPAQKDENVFGGPTITSSFAVRYIHPVYLLDLTKREAYTFYEKNGRLHVSVDSLSNHFEEIFYKQNPIAERKYSFQHLPQKNPETVAGKTCYSALAIFNNDTAYVKYTKEPLRVKSPLNKFFSGFPYPVLSFQAKVRHPVTEEVQGNAVICVQEIREEKLDDNLFKIPATAVRRKKVSLNEMKSFDIRDIQPLLH